MDFVGFFYSCSGSLLHNPRICGILLPNYINIPEAYMSGFILKLIAAATMLIDHAGLLLFPGHRWMRIVGADCIPAVCILHC